MKPLSEKQKQLIFDYCIGLSSSKEKAEAEHLIFSNEEAGELRAKIKSSLEPLDSLETQTCPEELVDKTVMRLAESARAGQEHLEKLLAQEESRTVSARSPFLHNLGKVLAAAAAIIFFSSLFIPTTNYLRQKSRQQKCQFQLGSIFTGLSNYMLDYNDELPATTIRAGDPWWKVGYQGKENHSNTRRMWLLVRNDYVKCNNFCCPGNKHSRVISLALSEIQKHNDFPTRGHITYSLRIRCPQVKSQELRGREVLMADLNPLFEQLPSDYSGQLKLKLNDTLVKLNSINHDRRGQNVLFCDGSVEFIKVRHTDISQDDIFTLRDTEIYQGIEVPSSEADAFLAP